ncbi:prephenate dehydrogenase [Mycoplasmatota bacterium WC44]
MKIGIVGLGLIGGTYAKNLIQKYEIFGIDKDDKSLRYAEENNFITKGYVNPSDILNQLDIVFICLYPTDIYKFIKENTNYFKPGAVITDAAGIKSKLVSEIEDVLPNNIDFVFAHPIAGREKIGVYHSNKDIFKNGNYVITPTNRNKKDNIKLIENLAYEIGFKSVSFVTPEVHDKIIAYTSQLTHVIALALVNSDNFELDIKKFIGDSYKDLTRIAKINTNLWSELFLGNKENLVDKIDSFILYMRKYKEYLENNDTENLIDLMNDANVKRTLLDGDNNEY